MSWRCGFPVSLARLVCYWNAAGVILIRQIKSQTCVCANRIFVQDGMYDSFSKKLAEKVQAFKIGEGNEEGVTHGPVIHAAAIEKVQRHVDDAVSRGAKVLVGGKQADRPGHFFEVNIPSSVQSISDVLLKRRSSSPCRSQRSWVMSRAVKWMTMRHSVRFSPIHPLRSPCLTIVVLLLGPLAALYRFRTEEEVLELANAPDVGLAG